MAEWLPTWEEVILTGISVVLAIVFLKLVIIVKMNKVLAVFYKPHNPFSAGFTRYENIKKKYWSKGNYQVYILGFNLLYFFISSIIFSYFQVKQPYTIVILVFLLLIGLGIRYFIYWILIPFGMGYSLAFLNNRMGGILNGLPIIGSYFSKLQQNFIIVGVLAILLLNSYFYARSFGVNFHLARSQAKIEIKTKKYLSNKPISRSKIWFKKISSTYLMISLVLMIYELFNILTGMYQNPPHERLIALFFGSEQTRSLPVRILSFVLLINISIFGITILMKAIQVEFYDALGERMIYSKVFPEEFNSEEKQMDQVHDSEVTQMKSYGIQPTDYAESLGVVSAQDRILGDVPLRLFRIALIFLFMDFLTSAFSTFELTLFGFPLTSSEIASLSIAAKAIFYIISLILIGGLYTFSDHIDDLQRKIQGFYSTHEYVDLESNRFLLQLGSHYYGIALPKDYY